jgi:hypothetical protein
MDTATGTVTVTHQDGSTALSAPVDLTPAGATPTLIMIPHILPLPFGNAFIFGPSSPVQLSGFVYFTRG